MRRELPTIVLSATTASMVAMALAFHRWVRPSLLNTYAEAELELGVTTAVGLSVWFLPAAVGVSVMFVVAAFVQSKRGARLRWLAIASGIAGTSFIVAAMAGYLPLLT